MRLKHWITVMLCMIILGMSSIVMAVSEQRLATDDRWVSGAIAEGEEANYYLLNLPCDGQLTVTYQGMSIYDSYYQLMNYDRDTVYYKYNVFYSSETDPKTDTTISDMSAGTYIIKVFPYGDTTGTYRLKASFSAFNNNEIEPNNTFDSAMWLPLGKKVTGALTLDDNIDFYCFEVTSKQTIILDYTSYIYDSYIELWDQDYESILKKDIFYAYLTDPYRYGCEIVLNPGIYYIKIFPYSDSSLRNHGRYTIKVSSKVLANKISISGNKCTTPGKTFTLEATVSPSNAANKKVTWKSADSYIASVDSSTGEVHTNRVGKVKITAYTNDGSNVSKSVTVIVKPSKETISSLYAYSDHSMDVYYSSQTNVTGYQVVQSTNKDFKKGTTKTYKTTSTHKTFTKCKKGKKYYYRVRAYYKVNSDTTKYGAWSSVKSITAK